MVFVCLIFFMGWGGEEEGLGRRKRQESLKLVVEGNDDDD